MQSGAKRGSIVVASPEDYQHRDTTMATVKPQNAPGAAGRPVGSANTASSIKIAQIARWRVAGVTLVRIAELLNMTPQGVEHIVKTPDYVEYEAALLNGHLSSMDEALAGRVDLIRKDFKVAVPAAMRALVDAVTQRRDLKAALEAAKEILKRDPDRTLPEVGDEAVAPGIPAEVLDAAVVAGNAVAASLQKDTKVN